MRILGICHDVLICSAGVVEDGRVIAAIAEERLDRRKQSRTFPTRAIEACLEQAGLGMNDIDEIAVAWNPAIDAETTPEGYTGARRWRAEHLMQVPARFLQMSHERAATLTTHSDLWQGAPAITYVDHYMAHVGNALFLSPFQTCAIAVMDGRGERRTGLLAQANGTDIEILQEVNYPHSLGLLYGAVTQFLGFRPDSDEWKVMALAAYGDSSDENPFLGPMRRLIEVDEQGGFRVSLEHFAYFNSWDRRMYSDRFVDLFGQPNEPGAELTRRHENIAAAAQRAFEDAMTASLRRLHQRTRLPSLVGSGGCFMNSVFNGKITAVTPFEECFITSCPDDSGTSIGAALYLCAVRTGKRPGEVMQHNYWGPEFGDEACHAVVQRFKLPHARRVRNPGRSAADDLVAGQLVGWFQGRAEFGQRALGARSILADPRRRDVKDLVNAAVKYRESFRPFAPAILAERVSDYFDCPPGTRVPFMEKVFSFRPEKREEVPGVVHVDGSGRLQTVDERSNPRYRELIQRFEAETGVPLVLNTSFNLNGEPIVHAPEDAVRTFFSCGLDVLYLGDVRIAKTG